MSSTAPDDVTHPTFDLRELLRVLQVMRDGNFSVHMPGHLTGIGGKIADTLNEIIEANQRMAAELVRVGQVVGKEGQTRQRVRFGRNAGAWGQMETSVNMLIDVSEEQSDALHVQAARCRRLAGATYDRRTSKVLDDMADSFERIADDLAAAGSPKPSARNRRR